MLGLTSTLSTVMKKYDEDDSSYEISITKSKCAPTSGPLPLLKV